jgi:prepilin-type N-terminal cleavage/methylation domain-containing protein
MNNPSVHRGFTLIELLIVVAIIAILAAIAVPNFLEAQTRAKVARCKADMRSLATAIETYHIDYSTYLYCNLPANAIWVANRPNCEPTFERLTSPIAYLTGVGAFTDPFKPVGYTNKDWTVNTGKFPKADDDRGAQVYYYTARNNTLGANARWDEAIKKGEPKPVWWFTEASGPDRHRHDTSNAINADGISDEALGGGMYDASNGTVSMGSIWRAGGGPGLEKDRVFYNWIQGTY